MKFLSDEWFKKVDELRAEAGELDVPPNLKSVLINITVTGDEGERKMQLKGGDFIAGHDPAAPTTLTLKGDLAKKIFIERDAQAGMQAFMAGEIKIEGDMSKLMELQMVQPSDKQKQLLKRIREITD
jgi:putative sterol carrier protein